jgi:hypothetical protein
VNNSSSGPIDPHNQSPNPAKRAKCDAVGRLLAYIALLDLRRPTICFSFGHPLFHSNLNHEIVAVKITIHHALLMCDGF